MSRKSTARANAPMEESHPTAPHETTSSSKAAQPVAASGSKLPLKWIAIGAAALVVGVVVAKSSSKPEEAVVGPDVPAMKDGRIAFSKAYRDRIQLQTAAAEKAPLIPTVNAVGMAGFNPKHTARIGTRLRGLVRSVRRFEGDEVKAGEVLAEIDSPELGEAQAQVSMLSVQAKTAERAAEREQTLADKNLGTAREAEVAIAEKSSHQAMLRAAEQKVVALAGGSTSGARIGIHVITSPIAGTIVERKVTQGELVEADRVAFLVSDLDHLWIELDVFEQNLHLIGENDEVIVRALNAGSKEIVGHVAQVGAVIDVATRSAPVRILVDNRERVLRPGQAVEAQIKASQARKSDAVLIPSSAVTYVDGAATVFILENELTVRPVAVELGDGDGEKRQVRKGLAPGDQVVTQGLFELKSELFR